MVRNLYGSKVILKCLQAKDIGAYLRVMVPSVRALLHVPSLDAEYAYLHQRIQAVADGATIFYCIYERFLGILIGAIEIRDRQRHPGQLYTWLHPAYWANNYFQEALYLASREYFCLKQDGYITARVDCANQRSYGALKRIGFADYTLIDGGYGKQYELVLINKW